MADPKIKYDISAQVSGDADVEKLASEIERLGRTLDTDLKAHADAAAQSLRELGAKNQAAQNFFDLKQQSLEAAKALEQAQAAAQAMAREIAQSGEPTRAQTGQLEKLKDAVNQANSEYQQSVSALASARSALSQYGLTVDGLAKTQQTLKTQIEAEKRAIDALGPSLQKQAADRRVANQALEEAKKAADDAAQAAKRAADELDAAFGSIGGKNAQAIRAEIEQVRNAMDLLARSGALTGKELELAMKQGASTIKLLERDLREATGSMTAMDRAARMLNSTIGQLAAFVSLHEIVSRTGRAFYDTVTGVQALQQGLKSVYGDAGTAAKQIAFLRETANAAGLKTLELSGAFTKFSASTKMANISLQDSNALFAEFTRAAGVLGISSAQAERGLEAISQMASKGTVAMEELRGQLAEAIPGATALAAKGLGLTSSELIKMVESGGLAAKTFIPAFTKSLKELQGTNDTLRGAIARVSNAFTDVFGKMSDSSAIRAITSGLNALAANMGTVVDVTVNLGKAFLALKFFELVRGLSQMSRESAVATAETAKHTAAVGANTAATTANTAATTANAAAKKAAGVAAATSAAGYTAAATSSGLFATTIGGLTGLLGGLRLMLGRVFTLLGGWPGLILAAVFSYKELGAAISSVYNKLKDWVTGQDAVNKKLKEQEAAQKEATQAAREAELEKELAAGREIARLAQKAQAQEQEVKLYERAADTVGKRVQAQERLIALSGQENLIAETQLRNSAEQIKAGEAVVGQRQNEIKTLELLLEKRVEQLFRTGEVNEENLKELDTLRQSIDAKKQELSQSQATVQGLKLERIEREIASEKLKDNSDKVGEYGKNVTAARAEVDRLLQKEKEGNFVKGELEIAYGKLAKATALYGDAVDDLTRKKEAEARMRDAEHQKIEAGYAMRQAEAESMRRLGESIGDANMVRQAEINLKQIELDRTRRQISADIEHQASIIEVTKAKLAELRLQPDFDKAKEIELQATIKMAEAKIAEARARGVATKALEDEITRLITGTDRAAKKTQQASKDMAKGWQDVARAAGDAAEAADGYARGAWGNRQRSREDDRFKDGRKSSNGEDLGKGVVEIGSGGNQFQNKDGMSSRADGSVIGAVEALEQLNQRVAKLFGDEFIGNANAIRAANLKLQLDEAAKYGVSNVPGNQEHYTNLRREFDMLVDALYGGAVVGRPKTNTSGTGASESGGGGGRSYVQNITIEGKKSQVAFADFDSMQRNGDVLRALQQAKRSAA